jgi:hypothetical protein
LLLPDSQRQVQYTNLATSSGSAQGIGVMQFLSFIAQGVTGFF